MSIRFLIIYLLTTFFSISQADQIDVVSIAELRALVKEKVERSVTHNDYLSIILDDLYLSSPVNKKPRIIEITCTLEMHAGSDEVFSTVHQSLGYGKPSDAPLNSYKSIIEGIPLAGVKNIKLEIEVRPIDDDKKVLFNTISKLFNTAAANNPAIQTLRDLIPTPEKNKSEIRSFSAIFRVPNSYLQYFRIKDNENLKIPVLEPNKPINIGFKNTNEVLPKNILSRFANIVIGKDIITDTENVSGVLAITPSKIPDAPIHPDILGKLRKLERNLRQNKRQKIINNIEEIENLTELIYGGEKISRKYDSIFFYTSLAGIYNKYLDPEADRNNVGPLFSSWVKDKRSFAPVEGYYQMRLKGIYKNIADDPADKARVVRFYFPYSLDNRILQSALVLQSNLHEMLTLTKYRSKYTKQLTEIIKL